MNRLGKSEDYEVIFTDIDGTLLDSKEEIMPYTLIALRKWTLRHELVLCSARPYRGILPILKTYDLQASVIALGGAHLVSKEGKTLLKEGMSVSEAREIIDFVKEERTDAVINVYTAERWLTSDKNDERVKKEERIIKAGCDEGSLSSLTSEDKVGKILLMCHPEEIKDIEGKMKKRFPDLTIAPSDRTLLEINPPHVSKATGVKKMGELLNIDLNKAIGFGDNYNDVPFLQLLKCPVLMGNAPEELKRRFANVTEDHDHEGIACFLQRFTL